MAARHDITTISGCARNASTAFRAKRNDGRYICNNFADAGRRSRDEKSNSGNPSPFSWIRFNRSDKTRARSHKINRKPHDVFVLVVSSARVQIYQFFVFFFFFPTFLFFLAPHPDTRLYVAGDSFNDAPNNPRFIVPRAAVSESVSARRVGGRQLADEYLRRTRKTRRPLEYAVP